MVVASVRQGHRPICDLTAIFITKALPIAALSTQQRGPIHRKQALFFDASVEPSTWIGQGQGPDDRGRIC